jgi:hypothetical protein
LLFDEISTYSPQKILFLTGHWALKFLNDKASYFEVSGIKQIIKVGTLVGQCEKDIQFVVASHPQGKPQNEWVQGVLESFALLQSE